MKRITVSLPDDLADSVRAAAGEGKTSAYVVAALREYQTSESLDKILADWEAETPITEEMRRWAKAQLDALEFGEPSSESRLAG